MIDFLGKIDQAEGKKIDALTVTTLCDFKMILLKQKESI